MRILALFLLASFAMLSCQSPANKKVDAGLVTNPASANGKTTDLAKIEFIDTLHDFGRLKAGEKVSYKFHFKNAGQVPLLVSSVKTSCGCTVSEKPDEPIAPGSESDIKVSFDSRGKEGTNEKFIRVFANTEPNEHILTIKAEVETNE